MRNPGRIALAALLAACLIASGADAKRKSSGSGGASATLSLQTKSVAIGVGWSWGSGTLRFQGKSYPFRIDGVSVNAVGVAASDATGYVYNLKSLADFEGTYTAIDVGGTLGGGKGILSMTNGNDVRITLHSTSQGIQAKAAPEGIKITLQD